MGLLCNGPLEVVEETPRCAAAVLGFGMRSTCAHRDFCETLKRRKLLLQSSSCPSSRRERGQGGFQLWGVCSPGGLEIGRERWDRELDESEQGSFLLGICSLPVVLEELLPPFYRWHRRTDLAAEGLGYFNHVCVKLPGFWERGTQRKGTECLCCASPKPVPVWGWRGEGRLVGLCWSSARLLVPYLQHFAALGSRFSSEYLGQKAVLNRCKKSEAERRICLFPQTME